MDALLFCDFKFLQGNLILTQIWYQTWEGL